MSMKIKFLIVAVMTSLLMFGGALAFADEWPDLTKTGSITVVVKDIDTNVPAKKGGVTLLKVAKPVSEKSPWTYEYVGNFKGCTASLDDLSTAGLASQLADFAKSHSLVGKTQGYDKDGQAEFADLSVGLYLATMSTADSDMAFEPFMITVPIAEDGKQQYDVVALPKAGKVEHRDGDGGGNGGDGGGGGKLPKTGQLWWPVPLLVGLGVLSLIIGFVRNRSARRKAVLR